MQEGAFFQDLAILTAAVGIVSVIFTKLKIPKVIGYLLAGVFLSPHTLNVSFFADSQSIITIGQLGIVFLMFTLGLEFSAREMKAAKHVSIPTAIFDLLMMIWLGYTLGHKVLGWGMVPSLFLGAAICDSATTLLAKTIEEMKWSSRPFVKFIFGTTIFEDILCVGVIALITGVATGNGLTLSAAAKSLGGLGVFFTGVIVFGMVHVPRFLNKVGKMDDEALLLTVLGCCFFISYLAFKLNFSLALGAFLVGILGASSEVRLRLVRLVAPLRNFFAAIFFVSVGILVNPAQCWEHKYTILILALLVVFGKGFNCMFMSILTGQKVKDAIQTGFGLAQIGEFAYMMALLYMTTTGDHAHPMYQIVVAVSLLTTCLNPIMLRISDPIGTWVENHIPGVVRGWLSAYDDWLNKYRNSVVPSRLHRHIQTRIAWLIIIGILNVCVSVAATMLSNLDYSSFSVFFNKHKELFFCLLALLFCIGMMFAPVTMLARSLGRDIAMVIAGRRALRKWQNAVRTIVTWFVTLAVYAVALVQVFMLTVHLIPNEKELRIILALSFVIVVAFFMKHFGKTAKKAGYGFQEALAAERRHLQKLKVKKDVILSVPDDFYGRIVLDKSSPSIGKTIKDLDIRAKTGASVVSIERQGERFRNPGADWKFQEGDIVAVIGESPQIFSFKKLFGVES